MKWFGAFIQSVYFDLTNAPLFCGKLRTVLPFSLQTVGGLFHFYFKCHVGILHIPHAHCTKGTTLS